MDGAPIRCRSRIRSESGHPRLRKRDEGRRARRPRYLRREAVAPQPPDPIIPTQHKPHPAHRLRPSRHSCPRRQPGRPFRPPSPLRPRPRHSPSSDSTSSHHPRSPPLPSPPSPSTLRESLIRPGRPPGPAPRRDLLRDLGRRAVAMARDRELKLIPRERGPAGCCCRRALRKGAGGPASSHSGQSVAPQPRLR
jgi:hypothetical protein